MNARSILSKLDDLQLFAEHHEPDILLISESWANGQIQNSMLNIDGYNLENELRMDRKDTLNGIGGGLLVYTREGVKIAPNKMCQEEFNQYCSFKVKGQTEDDEINIFLIYRPPSSSLENVENLCKLIQSAPRNSLFLGDFNFPGIDWQKNAANDFKSRIFLDQLVENDFTQLIDFPTHVKGNILDLALTNFPDKILNISSPGNLANSDHSILSIDILTNFEKTEEIGEKPDWNKCDHEELNQFYENVCWQELIVEGDAVLSWENFKEKIQEGINKHVPTVKNASKKKPRWFKQKLLKLTRKKERLWKEYLNYKDIESFTKYKICEKECKKAIRNAKRNYEKKIANDSNLKTFNAYVKKKTKNKTSVGPLLVDKKIISDNSEIANALNDYFCSVFSQDTIRNTPDLNLMMPPRKLENIIFSARDIEKKIASMKSSPATGPDGISTILLKQFAHILSKPLSAIYNTSMESGQIPRDWKDANVTPIFKKGAKGETSNYRPISLTSIPCKIMESLIKDEVMDHLLMNQLIKNSQHGFMRKKSCLTNLLEFFETVSLNLDNANSIDVIYLDFSKAFDKVPRRELIQKMEAHGISNNVLLWINNWLCDRRQRVILNGATSPWRPVTSGVPQGSVLGPLAFIIFINDIDLETSQITDMNKFADDTKLGHIVNNENDAAALQECLNKLCQWAQDWGMKFNETKCKVVHYGRKNLKLDYYMNNVKLEKSDCERDLGVMMHSSMKPTKQCEESARKAKAVLGMISRAFHYRDRKVFLKLYKQYVRCHLEYSVSVWNPWTETDIQLLENVQEKAVNMISGLTGKTYREKLNELKLQTLDERRKRYDMIQTYKIINGVDRMDKAHILKHVDPNRENNTRLNSFHLNLTKKTAKTTLRQHFFSNRIIDQWNGLPNSMKDASSVSSFKNMYDKTYLIY